MDKEKDVAAVKEILNKYAEFCNAGDFESWMSLWTDDGVQMPPDTPTKVGKEQIREYMKQIFDQFDLKIEIHTEEGKVHGDYGLTRCTYWLDLIPKAGGETIHAMPDGKALTIYERQPDGSWKIVYDCFNSNKPPA